MGITRKFFSRWQNWIGLFMVLAFVLIAIFAPLLSPKDVETQGVVSSYLRVPQPPSPDAPLGRLPDQTSVYEALVWGTRDALKFGVGVTAVVFLVGTLIGAVAAFFGGRVNTLLMWAVDSFLAFPIIAGVVFFQQINHNLLVDLLESTEFAGFYSYVVQNPTILESVKPLFTLFMEINPTALAFALLMWMPYARVMNASVMSNKQMEFVLAARVSGAKKGRVIFRHLIPNAIAPVLVLAAKDVGALVVLQTTFSFIGLGHPTPWASALLSGKDWIFSPKGIVTYWWVFLPITVALILFGVGWNLLGDGLIDAMNPRTRQT
ncbi:MAG: ABC transporter permease [Anaerolineaceae bacterium]|jgi:peptide/nickel transport system permease protein|nr:ABC transporter permease [Anaerolineaceae bacterium]MDD4042987.1 ABC transporter permease [Anaerolineaceae bacterium]MDD4577524.1 ABC transporter permease [Anaerolineaceae bacterium]